LTGWLCWRGVRNHRSRSSDASHSTVRRRTRDGWPVRWTASHWPGSTTPLLMAGGGSDPDCHGQPRLPMNWPRPETVTISTCQVRHEILAQHLHQPGKLLVRWPLLVVLVGADVVRAGAGRRGQVLLRQQRPLAEGAEPLAEGATISARQVSYLRPPS